MVYPKYLQDFQDLGEDWPIVREARPDRHLVNVRSLCSTPFKPKIKNKNKPKIESRNETNDVSKQYKKGSKEDHSLQIRPKRSSTFVTFQERAIMRKEVKQTSLWFALPGEVKNMIYNYLTDDAEYDVFWLQRSTKNMTSRKLRQSVQHLNFGLSFLHNNPNAYDPAPDRESLLTNRKRLELGRRLNTQPMPEMNTRGPAAWLSTCHQMHDQGQQVFYSKCTFSFRSAGLLKEFAGRMSPTSAAHILKIRIDHNEYGQPFQAKDVVKMSKSHETWRQAVNLCVDKFTNLEFVELNLHMNVGQYHDHIYEPGDGESPSLKVLPKSDWAKLILRLRGLKLNEFRLAANWGSFVSRNDADFGKAAEEVRRKVLGEAYTSA